MMVKRNLLMYALVLLATTGAVADVQRTASAQDVSLQTLVKLQTPKRAGKRSAEGGLEHVAFRIWLPDNTQTIRGVLINPFYTKAVTQEHWQAACRQWKFGILAGNLLGAKHDEFPRLVDAALAHFAQQSGHSELATAKFCAVGMSAGAGMAVTLAAQMPDRAIAVGPVCLEVGPQSLAAMHIPTMTIFGERDGRQYQKLMTKLPVARSLGARYGIAVQWRRRHEFGKANNLLLPYFDAAIQKRLAAPNEPLRNFAAADGWLGDVTEWGEGVASIARVNDAAFNKETAAWLPSETTAHVWRAFVTREPMLELKYPPGLGDKQPLVLHPVSTRIELQAKPPTTKLERIQAYSGSEHLGELTDGKLAVQFDTPGVYPIYLAATDAKGQRVFSRPNTIIVQAADGKLGAGPDSQDSVNTSPQQLQGHADWVADVVFSRDQRQLISGGEDETIRVWELRTGKLLKTIQCKAGPVTCLALRPDGKQLAVGHWSGAITIWDAVSHRPIAALSGHRENITSIAFGPKGTKLVTGSGDDSYKIWELPSGDEIMEVELDDEYDVTAVAFSPDGAQIATGDGESTLRLWDAATGEQLSSHEGHDEAITAVVYSPDGSTIATASWDDTIRVWSADGEPQAVLRGHRGDVNSIAITADGKRLATGSEDKTVRVWDLQRGATLATYAVFKGNVACVAVDRVGRRIAAGGNRRIQVYAAPR